MSGTPRALAPAAASRWSSPLLLALIVLPALVFRLLSLSANDTPHGDVTVSALVTESIAEGRGLVIPCRWLRPYPTEAFEGGTPVDGQPPMWPILATPLRAVFGEGYAAVKGLSLICGVLLLPVCYVAFRSIFTRDAAGLTVIAIAYSFVMIDYSANGSLYSLLALSFVLFAHVMSRPSTTRSSIALGAIFGVSMLLHQGSLVLIAALVGKHAIALRRGERLPTVIGSLCMTLAVAATVLLPWWIRNFRIFGEPFFQSHYVFVLHRMGVPWQVVDGGIADLVVRFDRDGFDRLRAVKVLAVWLVENATFFLRQLALLAPAFVLFAAYRAATLARDAWAGRAGAVGVIAIPVLYCAIACAWPVFQFRCVVPILPFVLALGSDAISGLRVPQMRRALTLIAALSIAVASGVTASRIPTHTYYYDGAEPLFREKERELVEVSRVLSTLEEGPVVSGELNLYYYSRYPWTFLPPKLEPRDLVRFVDAYGIRYLMTRRAEATRYAEALSTETHHVGTYFTLLELR